MRSALAIRSYCPQNTAKVWVICTMLCGAFCDVSASASDEAEQDEEQRTVARPIRVAVVGRPNAGKSTLVNRLLGEERLLTGPEAGITRDSIAVPLSNGTDRNFCSTTRPACGANRASMRSWKSLPSPTPSNPSASPMW